MSVSRFPRGTGLVAAVTSLALMTMGQAALAASSLAQLDSSGSPWRQPVKHAPKSFGVYDHDAAIGDEVAAVAWAGVRGLRARLRLPGEGWTGRVRLDGRGSDTPSVSVNDRGDVAVAWTRHGKRRTRLLVSRRPAGGRWTTPRTLAIGSPAYGTDGPDVSVGPRGKVSVGISYRSRGESKHRPRVFTFIDGQWGNPATLARRFGESVRVVTGPEGHVTAAWLDSSGRRCISNGAGRAWTPARCWSRPRTFSQVELAVDDQGRVYLMTYNGLWSRAPGGQMRRESLPFGRFPAFGGEGTFWVDASSAGRAAAVWCFGRQTGRDSARFKTFASVRRTDGTWSPRVQLARSSEASVAVTDKGTAYAAWHGRNGIRVARKAAGQAWSDRRAIVGKAASSSPVIVVNDAGEALLAFMRWFTSGRASLWTSWRP